MGLKQDAARESFHLAEDSGDLPLVGHRRFHPLELLRRQGDGHGFASHFPGPLVARPAFGAAGAVLHRALAYIADPGQLRAAAGEFALQLVQGGPPAFFHEPKHNRPVK